MSKYYKLMFSGLAAINAAPVPLIIDTDMGFDVDDVGAICLANALVDLGEANILAIVHDTGFDKGIGGVSSINNYYGHNDILLGAYKGKFGQNPNAGKGTQDQYLSDIINRYPGPIKKYFDVPTATETYR